MEDHLHLHQFLRAIVVMLVGTVAILIHFVIAIFFSLCMYTGVFGAITVTGFLTPLHGYAEGKLKRGVQTGLYMLFSSVRDLFCRGKCLPIFCGGVDVYVLYASVCVRKYTHTAADRCPTHDNKKRHKFVATVNAKRRKFRHTCQFSHHFSNQSTGSRCDCVLHLKTLPRAGRSRLSTQRGANSQY